ncbi:MAG: hypothetical protein V7K27_00225 [Nostoc sp.]|uniref:hypothetical protein n=1 Tax=Nostoc sp. TaxID=1180 RepID=UPI002FFBEF53
MTISWSLVDEVEVTDTWKILSLPVTSDVFRITTTITDIVGWESQRIQSGSYLQFIYPDPLLTKSKKNYIPVSEDVIIYELAVPTQLKEQGYMIRLISCRLSSRWVGKINFLTGFAKWNLKVEELV